MQELFTLGKLHLSDFLKESEKPHNEPVPLTLCLEEATKAVRLDTVASKNLMYGKYWYRSGMNATMTNELEGIAHSCLESMKTKKGDLWLDIACNDGTLLKAVPESMIRVGIDPADDTFTVQSRKVADLIIQDYFNAKVFKNSIYGTHKAKIITCIAMFYDLEEPGKFLDDIYEIMDDEGLLVLQMSYTPLMIRQLAFDNICHEHVYYWTLKALKNVLEKCKFSVVDCQLNDANGGSFRIYIRKQIAKISNFRTAPFRDVANFRIESTLLMEERDKVETPEPYLKFFESILELKTAALKFIKEEKAKGKKIWGYGASTKGNTLLQWFELDNTLIEGIAERSPFKFGLKTVGTNIPIYSEAEMREVHPDYLLVLPWHFISEFIEREQDYLKKGGKFIVPCPKFEVIGLDK